MIFEKFFIKNYYRRFLAAVENLEASLGSEYQEQVKDLLGRDCVEYPITNELQGVLFDLHQDIKELEGAKTE